MRPQCTLPRNASSTEQSTLSDADYGAIGAALEAFRQAAAGAAADPCWRSPQCVVEQYITDTPRLCPGLAVFMDTPVTRERQDGPETLRVAFLWLLMEGQALSPLGQRFLTASILTLDLAALVELIRNGEGGGDAAP